jgi:hypothetical protein
MDEYNRLFIYYIVMTEPLYLLIEILQQKLLVQFSLLITSINILIFPVIVKHHA